MKSSGKLGTGKGTGDAADSSCERRYSSMKSSGRSGTAGDRSDTAECGWERHYSSMKSSDARRAGEGEGGRDFHEEARCYSINSSSRFGAMTNSNGTAPRRHANRYSSMKSSPGARAANNGV